MREFIDFIMGAGPWLLLGLFLAVFFAKSAKKKKSDETQEDYGLLGMLIGMSLGSALSLATEHSGISMSMGMLIGLLIGSCFKKEETEGGGK